MGLAQGHSVVTPVRLDHAILWPRTKHSTTEPLLSHYAMYTFILSTTAASDLGLHYLPTSHKNVKLKLRLQLPTINDLIEQEV